MSIDWLSYCLNSEENSCNDLTVILFLNPPHLFLCALHYEVTVWLTAVIMSMFQYITVCMQVRGLHARCPNNIFAPLYMSTSCVLTSCDLILFIFMRSSKLYLICAADLSPSFPYMCMSNWGPTSERSIIMLSVDVFYKCVCWFITYAEASVHSKMEKCINIFRERQAVDSSENKSTSARLHANSRAILNGETIDENR